MSDTLVPNEVLAWLQYQLDVMDEVSITQICKTNFTEGAIREAKSLLYESLNRSNQMPSRRRDEKGERSLQDIIKVLKETDPDDVPTFVAKDLRKLPPVTFDHVDVTRLLRDITSLRSSLAEMELKFEASQSTINDLRSEVVVLRNTISLCGSSETSNNNLCRRGAQCTSPKSAKLESPPAADPVQVTPRPARPAPPPVVTPSTVVAKSTRNYAKVTAVNLPKKQLSIGMNKEGSRNAEPSSSVIPPLCKSRPDKEGFITVERRKKRKNPPCQNKCGTAPTDDSHPLRPAVPSTQLYVSRLHHTVSARQVVEYIQAKTQFVLRVEQLESRTNMNFKSFVVRVPTHRLPTFMNEKFWPQGVVFRRFRGRLQNVNQRPTSHTSRV